MRTSDARAYQRLIRKIKGEAERYVIASASNCPNWGEIATVWAVSFPDYVYENNYLTFSLESIEIFHSALVTELAYYSMVFYLLGYLLRCIRMLVFFTTKMDFGCKIC